ncbi:MAG TPA: hypothetical protein ENN91_01470 [Firmicutes bacterium]|nr:hypothetical protein [Bacillota bacterium]
MMAGNTISIAGPIGQDYYGAANTSTVTGSVGRHIRASMSNLIVDAPVGGDMTLFVGDLSLGPRADVSGSITYTSEKEAVVDSTAIIGGSVKRLDPPAETGTGSARHSFWSFIRPVLSMLLAALILVLLFPVVTGGSAVKIKEKPWPSIGIGALIVFVAPLVALILMLTVFGLPVGIITILLYIALIYLVRVVSGYFLAMIVFERFGKRLHPLWIALIGVFVLSLLIKIPYVGWIINLASVLFAAGAFILYLAGKKEKTNIVTEGQ